MSLGNEIGKFLWNIAEQKDGFKFGEPWRNTGKSLGLVIPIIREKNPKRKYRMMEEVGNKIEIEDTGDVNNMRITSKADENVFIRSGVILSGDGQTRMTVSGKTLIPHTTEDLKVKCVYASKPTQRGAKMKHEDYAPLSVLRTAYDSQRDTWNSVNDYAHAYVGNTQPKRRPRRLGFSGAKMYGASINTVRAENLQENTTSDDLLGTMKEVEKKQKDIENAINDMPVQKNQVGALIFDIDSIVGFEIFDSPESWKALHKKVIKKYGKVLRKKQEKMVFELKPEVIPEKISEFIEELMKSNENQFHSNSKSKTMVIDGDKHIGEYTLLEGKVIHVITFQRDTPKKQKYHIE